MLALGVRPLWRLRSESWDNMSSVCNFWTILHPRTSCFSYPQHITGSEFSLITKSRVQVEVYPSTRLCFCNVYITCYWDVCTLVLGNQRKWIWSLHCSQRNKPTRNLPSWPSHFHACELTKQAPEMASWQNPLSLKCSGLPALSWPISFLFFLNYVQSRCPLG